MLIFCSDKKRGLYYLPINQTPARFLSFSNLKLDSVHNILEAENQLVKLMWDIFIFQVTELRVMAQESNIFEIIQYGYHFKHCYVLYHWLLVLPTEGIASATVKLKAFSLLGI